MRKLNHLILILSHFFGSYPVHKSLYLTVNEPFLVGVKRLGFAFVDLNIIANKAITEHIDKNIRIDFLHKRPKNGTFRKISLLIICWNSLI